MKKVTQSLLALLFAALPVTGFADAADVLFSQKNASNTAWANVIVAPTASSALAFNSSKVPISTQALTLSNITSPAATNLTLGTGTYGTALTVASATGAVTATTTLADQGGTIAAQRNGLAPAQGLVFNGTAGATVTLSAYGTNPFTHAVRASTPGSVANIILAPFEPTVAPLLAINSSNKIIYSNVDAVLMTSVVTLSANVMYDIAVVRESTASSKAYLYVNGVLDSTFTDATNYTTAIRDIGFYNAANFYTGTIRIVGLLNRALSAAEVLALYQSGAVASEDYNTASNTALSLGNFANSGYETFTGASATGFTAINTSVDGYAYTTNQFTLIKGARYRMTFTCTLTSGQVPVAYLGVPGSSVLSAQTRIASGSNVLEFTATASGAANGVFYSFNGEAVSYAISSFALTPLGALLAPDSAQVGGGLTWYDTSGNAANITLPATGVSWSLPTSGKAFSLSLASTTAGSAGAGALVVAGGISAAGASYFGGAVTAPSLTSPASTNLTLAGGTAGSDSVVVSNTLAASSSIIGAFKIGNGTAATNVAIGGGKVNIGNTTAGSAGAGALVVQGGISAAGASYFGGSVTANGAGRFVNTFNNTAGGHQTGFSAGGNEGGATTHGLSLAFIDGGGYHHWAPYSGYLTLGAGTTEFGIMSTTQNGLGADADGTVLFKIQRATGAATFAGAVTIAGTVIHTLSATPASAFATGTVGTMSWDASYIYICTAANTWKRVAIATW